MPITDNDIRPAVNGAATLDATRCGLLLDSLLRRATDATIRCARGPKWYASALRISRSQAWRHMNGKHNPAHAVLLEKLATADGTTPWPIIAEEIAVVMQAGIARTSKDALYARLRELTDHEHDLEAEENRQTALGTDHEAAAMADLREAEVQLERCAIRRELAARNA